MAKIIENKKGFKVINLSLAEVNQAFGGIGICDYCNEASLNHNYIAVLNSCYCKKCYDNFCENATYYKEDSRVENINFERAKNALNL